MRIKIHKKSEEFQNINLPKIDEVEQEQQEENLGNIAKFFNATEEDGVFLEKSGFKSPNFVKKKKGWMLEDNGKIWCNEIFIGIIGNYLSFNQESGLWVNGKITAISGEIGGFTLGANTIFSSGNEIVLDSNNKRIEIGTSNEIILDGVNKKITVGISDKIFIDGENKRIQSDNYVSGIMGTGFHLSDNLLEVGNIACRGLIRTAVFQKDVVNVMGGNFAVLDGDVLDADMTALDNSNLITKAITTFSVGDILRIKDGTDDEWLEVTATVGIADSYSESNQDVNTILKSNGMIAFGQSFTGNGNILNSCKFYLKKYGSPTGNAVAKIYAHTGTFGTDGKPTGAALATSENFDVSTLTTSHQLITFNFTGAGQITLENETYYCVVVEYNGGDNSNRVELGRDNSSPTHNGNSCYKYFNTENWTNYSADSIFYIYTTGMYSTIRDKKGNYAANDNPVWKKGATVVNYKQSGDGGVYMTASENNAPYLSVFTHTGEPWTDLTTRLRLGNLNGFLGHATDLYGIAIGETTKYLKYDPTNGLRIAGRIKVSSFKTAGENITNGNAVIIGDGSTYETTQITEDGVYIMTDTDWVGQTITLKAESITSVTLQIRQNHAADKTIRVSLRATSGGLPTGVDLVYKDITMSYDPAYLDKTFTFTSPETVTPNTKYAIIVRNITDTAAVNVKSNTAGGYSGGNSITSANSGSSWSADTRDLYFKTVETSTIAGKIYKTDASNGINSIFHSNFIGFAFATVSKDSEVPIILTGSINDLSGLSVGSIYYLSNTVGAIALSAGDNSKKTGIALSATELLILNT